MNRYSLVMILALVACGKSKDGSPSGKAAEGGKPVELAALGLKIDISGDTTVDKGMSEGGVMVTGEDIGVLTVDPAKTPQSIEDAKSDAKMYTPKDLKADALPDGWAVTYNNTGGAGANYFVQVRRDIAGKSYMCTTTGGDADRAKAVLAACKTLRK